MNTPNPADQLRRLYPPILTTAHVAEMMHCTIGDVRDKAHRGELPPMRWGQQLRFFRDEVIKTLLQPDGSTARDDEEPADDVERDETRREPRSTTTAGIRKLLL